MYAMRDDRNAVARLNWTSRRNRTYAIWLACKTLPLLWYAYFYYLVPIVKYFIPKAIYNRLHRTMGGLVFWGVGIVMTKANFALANLVYNICRFGANQEISRRMDCLLKQR